MLKGHVLLVDDEADVREILRNLLEAYGLSVEEAHDGLDAFEKVRRKKYDAIVTDLFMPRMSGQEFVTEARKMANGKTLILGLTGCIESHVWQDIYNLVDARLHKPFSENIFLDLLKPHLGTA